MNLDFADDKSTIETGKLKRRSPSPEYYSWHAMLDRCTNPKSDGWKYYGGRGITVCERWRNFDAFVEDMGPRPEGMTLDRIDGNGDYRPGNVRWATATMQGRNKSSTHLVTAHGKTQTLKEWAEELGINYHTVRKRLIRGAPIEDVLRPGPIGKKKKQFHLCRVCGKRGHNSATCAKKASAA